MIPALEYTRFLDGKLVSGPLHHAQHAVGPVSIFTDHTGVLISEIKAPRTEPDLFFTLMKLSARLCASPLSLFRMWAQLGLLISIRSRQFELSNQFSRGAG
jgi:hypothetical protein